MNDQKITQVFGKITAQADACRVERNVREQYRKKNHVFEKRPIKGIAILTAVLAMIMIPAAAFGIVYGYHAYRIDNGYRVAVSGDMAPIKLEESKMEELGQYVIRFENGTVANIHDFGKPFDSYDALDAWLDGVLLTSPMLDGECMLYCTDDNVRTPIAIHVTGQNTIADSGKICAVNITVPLMAFGEAFGWGTNNTDMLSSQKMTAKNGIEAELVVTETSVTAFFAHNGVLYRLNISGNHEEATAVLTDIIGTMK